MKAKKYMKRGNILLLATLCIFVLGVISASYLIYTTHNSETTSKNTNKTISSKTCDAIVDKVIYQLKNLPEALNWIPDSFTGKQMTTIDINLNNQISKVFIYDNANNTYLLFGTTGYRDQVLNIFALLKKEEGTQLEPGIFQSALSVQVDPQTTLPEPVNFGINYNGSNAYLSGEEHLINGTPTGDISHPGAALTSIALQGGGQADWNITGQHNPEQLIGSPQTSNTEIFQGNSIDGIIKYAKESYDTKVDLDNPDTPIELDDGSNPPYTGTTFSQSDPQVFGDIDNWKVVYVSSDGVSGNTMQFAGQFEGYGLMVIEVDNFNEASPLLHLTGQSGWTGLILVSVKGNTNLSSSEMISLTGGGNNGPHIIGGLTLKNGPTISDMSAGLIKVAGNAAIGYSSLAIQSALTPHKELSEGGFSVISRHITNVTGISDEYKYSYIDGNGNRVEYYYYEPYFFMNRYYNTFYQDYLESQQ